MTIKRLKPIPGEPVPLSPTPRCEANVSTQNEFNRTWRIGRYPVESGGAFQCSRPSVVRIDRKSYCRLHGGHLALAMYLDGRLVDRDT